MRRVLFAIALASCASAIGAQESQTAFGLKPVLIITQHLYAGDLVAPRAVFYDQKHDELWVADTQRNLIGVFTPDGVPLFSFTGGDHLRYPVRLTVGPTGNLLVIEGDRTHIRIFNYRGSYLGDLPLKGAGEKPNFGAVAYDSDGNLYVGENIAGQVLVYDRELKLRRRIGTRGNEEGQFQSIADIAVDSDGNVFVIDHQVLAVQMFDRRGDYVRGWGHHEMGREHFSLPEGVALDSKGHVIVVDALRHEIKFFDKEGRFIDRFGGFSAAAGGVAFPSAVTIDGKDRVYVAERGNARVQVFEQAQLPAARPTR